MIEKTFIGMFTGKLSKIGNVAFNPPIPIEKGKCYVIRLNQINGQVQWHEVLPVVPLEKTDRLQLASPRVVIKVMEK